MRTKIVLFSLLMLTALVSACTPYKMEIRQGNYVTPEMREKLKLGMSKTQVRYVLGTPMINDVFHENRWDYLYSLEQDRKLVERQGMTLYFEGDVLTRIVDADPASLIAPAPEGK
ncbi:MAG TPA: outer membrane protein assembly factor BamE [Gallionella sp.]